MNEEIKRDRSPNYPKVPLQQAVEMVNGLHKKAGKSQIRAEVAVSALGYGGMNGAALTALGVLNQYGLIDRDKGGMVAVSPLAIRLIHPVNEGQTAVSRREASLKPKVFFDLFTGGFQHCGEDVLANHLIQEGFTQDGARKAANVFKANVEFAKLQNGGIKLDSTNEITESEQASETSEATSSDRFAIIPPPQPAEHNTAAEPAGKKVLATYAVPIGANEVKIVFTGDTLHPEDFDALSDYVSLFKKQFERTQKAESGSKRKVNGVISTPPRITGGNRVTFLLALNDGQVLSCLSGAGTNFNISDFVDGQKIDLIGETKADLISGETQFFVFSEFQK